MPSPTSTFDLLEQAKSGNTEALSQAFEKHRRRLAVLVHFKLGSRTREFAEGNRVKAFSGFERKAEMKLDELESATSLLDLDLPGNRLEALRGDRQGQYSIRINDQWRICFEWPQGAPGPVNVEIIDYH